jgi:predicted  nucleic acid-binding Zn-ribbon protein
MLQGLKTILDLQELDMQMIRLMELKKKLNARIDQVKSMKQNLENHSKEKQHQVTHLKRMIKMYEERVDEIAKKIKQLEAKQTQVKKVEEFNALTQEIASAEREQVDIEQQVSAQVDQLVAEEENLATIAESLSSIHEENSLVEEEIYQRVQSINEEGRRLLSQRLALAEHANTELLNIYQRLFRNKHDRVIVPIENRTCSGCHIVLTAQHENIVRKGDKLVFCEHCSRVHYWQSPDTAATSGTATKARRRRTPASAPSNPSST